MQSKVTDFFKWVGLSLRTVTSFSYKGNLIENVLLLLKCVLFFVYSKVATLSNNSTVDHEFIKV